MRGRATRSWWRAIFGAALLACRAEPSALEVPTTSPEDRTATVQNMCTEGLRSWDLLDASGRSLGRTRGRCLGRLVHPEAGPLWHFVAQLELAGAAAPSWELHLWLGEDGQPRFAEHRTAELVTRFRWTLGDTSSGRVDLVPEDIELTMERLGERRTLAEAGDLWVMPAHGLYLRELMIRLGAGVRGAPATPGWPAPG